jgi:uncharacterized protein (DUF1810 family)
MTPSAGTIDRFNLERFVAAQAPIYATALRELGQGRKRTHWMWFIFPQVEGLGHSSMAQRYAIRSRNEAQAYLATPLLGARLLECTAAVLDIPARPAFEIFGSPDDLKFHSSMTLFNEVDRSGFYAQALDRFFEGKPDNATLDILHKWDGKAGR